MSIEQDVRRLYGEAADFFQKIAPRFGPEYRKYEILYGPPVYRAPVMFVGFQPGGAGDLETYSDPEIPAQCVYAFETWPLARRLQDVFGAGILEATTGLNTVFARAPNKSAYSGVPAGVREDISRFSISVCRQLFELLEPQRLVFIGLQTVGRLGALNEIVRSDHGRALAAKGEVDGIPAMSVLHLSGCRISAADRRTIAAHLRAFAGLPSLALEGA